MVEAAYRERAESDEKLLSALDREYVQLLMSMGETEKAKEFVQEQYDSKTKDRAEHLLSSAEREYVELLIKLGETNKARLIVESAYEEKVEEGQS